MKEPVTTTEEVTEVAEQEQPFSATMPVTPFPGVSKRAAAVQWLNALRSTLKRQHDFKVKEEHLRKGMDNKMETIQQMLEATEDREALIAAMDEEILSLRKQLEDAQTRIEELTKTLAATRRKLREPTTEGSAEDIAKLRARRKSKEKTAEKTAHEAEQGAD